MQTFAKAVAIFFKLFFNRVTIRLGEYDTQSEEDCLDGVCADPVLEIPVHRAIPHPGYSDRNTNRKDDIALVRLANRVRYSCKFLFENIC